MADQPVEVVFLTELDALFDTRMGTLMRVSKDRVPEIIKSGYLTRDRDRFKDVEIEVFQKAYRERDKGTLLASTITPMFWFLNDFCKSTYIGNAETPFLRKPVVVVNTYPYRLTPAEIELIQKGVASKTAGVSEIRIIFRSLSEMTPGYLKKHADIVSLYDPLEWLEVHSVSGLLKTETCPQVNMTGPLLFRNLDVQGVTLHEYHEAIKLMARPFVQIDLLPVIHFCPDVLIPKKKPSQKA